MSEPRAEYAIVRANGQRTIASYGERTDVADMANRIRAGVPNLDGIPDKTVVTFAQIALAHGLNPFLGEAWLWKDNKGKPAIMVGIKGLRKAARRQCPYQIEQRNATAEECNAHGLDPSGAIAAVTAIYRRDSVIPGLAFKPTLGIGIWKTGDRVPATKTPFWVAQKRSEADALRKAYDLPFITEESEADADGAEIIDAVSGDYREIEAALTEAIEGPPIVIKSNPDGPGHADDAADELFGDWDPDLVAAGEEHDDNGADPDPEPQPEKPKARRAAIQTDRWPDAMAWITERTDHYKNEWHMLTALLQGGFLVVHDDNLKDAIAFLMKRVEDKQPELVEA